MAEHPQFEVVPATADETKGFTWRSGVPAAFIEPSTGIEYVIAHVEEA